MFGLPFLVLHYRITRKPRLGLALGRGPGENHAAARPGAGSGAAAVKREASRGSGKREANRNDVRIVAVITATM